MSDDGDVKTARLTPADVAASIGPGGVVANSLGYARLQGCGRGALDYIVRTKMVTIGRLGGGADCVLKTNSRKVGRKHARLQWDEQAKRWGIVCLSRKGVLVVNGAPVIRGCPATVLESRSLVEIGDTMFYFLLPTPPLIRTSDMEEFEKRVERERTKLKRKREQERGREAKNASSDHRKSNLVVKAPRKRPKPAPKKKPSPRTTDGKHAPQESRRTSGGQPFTEEQKREWTKKEKQDFVRALFAVGVDRTTDSEENESPSYNWTKFRNISPLPRKSDEALEKYYERVIADVEAILENEEMEKRTKGPRTKHKPGCDCVVCNNTRKSRRRKSENADQISRDEERETEFSKVDRLVGLVTAQKLRKRMAILDASKNIDSPSGKAVIKKLAAQPAGSAAGGELPIWWENGRHDRGMMLGCARYGVGQWKALWADEFFADVRESGEDVWPSEKTAMKRLREVASAINAEMRREKKKLKRKAELEAKGGPPPKKRKSAPKNTSGTATKAKKATKKDVSEEAEGEVEEYREVDEVEEEAEEELEEEEDEEEDEEEEEDNGAGDDDRNVVEYYVEEVEESGAETQDEESDSVIVEEETVEVTASEDDSE